MEQLKIEEIPSGRFGMRTMRIMGFRDMELATLRSLPNWEARDRLFEMLDKRNDKIATNWGCGYGIYAVWFDDVAAYVNVGESCD